MKTQSKALLAGIVGVALVGGGATFALWSDSASVESGSIIAGHLALEPVGAPVWQDVSPEHNDPVGIPVIDDYLMVPGDVFRMTQDIEVDLEGENVAAVLEIDLPAAAGGFISDVDGLSGSYTVTDQSSGVSQTAQLGDAIAPVSIQGAGERTYTVQLDLKFNSDSADQGDAGAGKSLDLGDVTYTLTQAR